jgi:hypothetical protein
MDQRAVVRKGISCFRFGCIVVIVLFVALAGWIASGFIIWRQCRIPLPDGSGSIVYMARLNKILCAEWDRKVRFETNTFPKRDRWVPGDPAGASPVNVYWYPAKGNSGPYIKLADPILDECYIDLKHGTTLFVKNRENGNCFVGEMSSTWPKTSYYEDQKGNLIETVDGHPVHKLDPYVASNPGVYLGRIEYPYNKFVPAKQAPEMKPLVSTP